ncbi:MAG TPA: isopeptide-forming domain-containing fimbrial protein, partial [Marmoricola sp.]
MRLRRLRIRAVFSVVASAAVVAATFAILPATAAQAADGDPGDAGLLRFSKTGDTSVLVGQPISYELTATNSGSTAADDEYNLSVRDVLPVGVSYKQTTAPKGLGDPTIVTLHTDPLDDTSPTYQVLIWRNVSDLPAGATQRIDFDVTVDADTYPVGSTVANTADAYAQNNPRAVPKFDANGDPKSGSYTDTESSAEFDTAISALTIDKTEPSPEHELMRGVHDDTTTYTLKVTNNGHAATNGNTVTDYLPAGLEFLGCGGVDNGSTHEYGDVDLTTTPTIGAGSCMTPLSVETVNSDLPIGLAPGVYTKVTWSLPDLGDNDTWTTTYAAGIPQRANTMDFGATTPSPASGEQGANLDNNTGASTRENASSSGTQDGEQGLTNLAQVSGSYTGAIQGAPTDKTVFDSDSTTVTAEDLAMQKQVDTDTGTPGDQKTFTQGGTAQYTLHVETGEYADASGVTVTDVIPDGLCPLKAGTTDTCATSASDFTATGAQVDSITQNPDHTWTVVFKPFDQAAQKVQTITYTALMGATYAGHDQDPTVSGDDYTNSASLVGTTTSLAGVDPPASDQVQIADVRDASSATIVSGGPTLSKTMMEQATPYTCDKADGTYTDNTTTAKDSDALTFRVGDRVCFDISVNFSAGNSTRNPVVTDFLPDYVTYEAGSAVAVSPADNVAAVLDDSDATSGAGGRVQWAVGTAQGGGDRFVAKGGVFEWRLSAIVTSEPDAAPKPDITANLAKLTWVDTAGTVGFLRDQVDFSAGATPPIAIEKSHDGSSTVVGGSVVPYTIVVTNKGDDDDHDNVPVKNVVVRDDLPTGISCSDVTSAPAAKTTGTDLPVSGYTCDPGTGVMQWTLAGPLAAGASSAIAYSVTIPGEPGARTAFKNVTGVVSYDTDSNRGTTTTHYPSDNIDPTVCDATGKPDCDVPAATDDDTVTVKDVSISKAQTTAIDEAGNNAASQAVIGEEITYTVTGTIPAHTTVYDGTVSDTLPAGIKLTDAHPSFDAGAPDVLPSPVGFSANYLTGSASIDLTGQYVNDTAQDQTFTLTLTGQVTTASANVNDTALKNTAKFTYKSSDTSSTYTHTASKTATVVEPSPSLTKTHTPVGAVASGDTLTYTLKAANAAGRPTLYDSYVIDCIPAGLTFGSATAPSGTSVDTPLVAGTGAAPAGNGCAVGTEVLRWHIGAIAGGANVSLPYTVTVDPGSVGGQVYTNSATLIGSDLDDGVEDPTAIERSYSDTDQDSATVAGSTLTKASSTPLLAIGDVASFTVTATVPANVNYFDATVTDVLPSGVDATAVSTVSTACSYPDNSPCSIAPTGLTPSSQTIGWFLGDLIADAKARTVTITYTAPVVATSATAPKAGDALTNRAVLGWNNTNGTDPTTVGGTPDHTAGPATSTDHVTEPSVSIAKTVSDATPDPGQSFTYTVKATNGSGTYVSAAHQVVVTDAVPTGVVVDASTISDGGTISGADPQSGGGTITWTLSSLAKGATAQVTYKARLQSPSPSTALTNTATVAGYCSVTVPAGSTCADAGGRTYPGTKPTAHATVTPALPHVVVSKTADGGDVAYLGTSKHFTVTITSDGASKAYNIGAVDTLPDNWTYDANSARVSVVGAAASAVEPSVSGQTLTWTNLGDLPAAGDTIVITYSATPDNPQAATDPGVGHTTDHTNSVAVTAQDADGQTQDAAHSPFNGPGASATTHIDSADVTITKSADDNPVAGNDHSWTLTVGNDGPDTAVGPFTVSDDVPAPLTGVSAQGQGWTCTVTATGGSADARHVSCSRTSAGDTLAKGASFPTITVAGHIPATTAPDTDVANTATVDGISTYDPDEPGGHNDTSTTPGTTTLIADLGVTKTLTNAPIVAGGTATYNVVVKNNGPSMYYGSFVVTDPVPAGTTFKSVQVDNPAQWQCTTPQVGGTGQVVCTWGADGTPPASGTTLAAGDSRSVTISVDVDPGRTADITNTATVTSAAYDHDPNPANDTSSVGAPTLTSADLAITKTASDTSVVAGTDTTYTLAVKNRGPSDASDVTVTDTLPSGFSFDSLDGSVTDWSCVSDHAAPETLTCTLTAGGGTLGSGDSAQPIVLHATVSAGHGAEKDVANTASVDSDTPDPDPSNNDSTATLDVTRSADVSLTKTHSGNGLHGSVVDFTLTARNAGPSTAESVRVVDTLPSGLTYVSVSGTDWTCSYSAPDLTCDYVGPLAPDSAAPAISVNTTVTAAQFTSATNTAVVSTSTPGDDPSNNEATDTVVVSDVGLTKTTSTDTRAIGQRADYTLTVTLPAQVNLYNLVLTDTLPDGIDPASVQIEGTPGCELGDHTACNATATPLTSDGQTVGWGLGDLPKVSGSQAKRIITLTYSAIVEDVPGNTDTTGLVNAASAGWDFSDRPKPTKVTDPHDSQTMPSTATVTVVEPKLTIDKTVNDTAKITAKPGQRFDYEVTLTNTGDAPAYDATVTDKVPAGIQVVGGTVSDGGTLSGDTITWTIPGPIEPGASKALTLTYGAKLASPAPDGAQTNTATIDSYHSTAADGDADRSYTDAPTASAEVDPLLPHVSIAKSVLDNGTPSEDALAYIGEPVTWRVTATNDTDVATHDVTITDTLPPNWSYVPGSAQVSVLGGATSQVEPTVSGQTLTWTDLGDLPSKNDAIVVDYAAKPGAGVVTSPGVGSGIDHVNTAAVTAEDDEGRTGTSTTPYNGAPDTAEVHIDSADLELVKVPQDAPAVAGSPFTWTLTVTNHGGDTAVGPFTVTDTMPAEMEGPFSASGHGWTCSGSTTITCSHPGTLADGSSLDPITVTGTIPAGTSADHTLTNTATVGARTYDPTPGNNTDSSSARVGVSADLSMRKNLEGALVAGQVATYTLDVTNNGPSVHHGTLTVTDPVPDGTTFVSASGEDWSCAEPGGTITCTHDAAVHPVGAVGQIIVRVKVDADRTDPVVNTATVTGDGPTGSPDPDPTNDSDTVSTDPGQSADVSINKESLNRPFISGTQGTYRFTV